MSARGGATAIAACERHCRARLYALLARSACALLIAIRFDTLSILSSRRLRCRDMMPLYADASLSVAFALCCCRCYADASCCLILLLMLLCYDIYAISAFAAYCLMPMMLCYASHAARAPRLIRCHAATLLPPDDDDAILITLPLDYAYDFFIAAISVSRHDAICFDAITDFTIAADYASSPFSQAVNRKARRVKLIACCCRHDDLIMLSLMPPARRLPPMPCLRYAMLLC